MKKIFLFFYSNITDPFHGLFPIVNVPSVNIHRVKNNIIPFHGERDTIIRNKMLYATLALSRSGFRNSRNQVIGQ